MKIAALLFVAGTWLVGVAHASYGRWPLHVLPSATPSLGYDSGSDRVTSIALDPNQPSVLRAGTIINGVYTSVDGGAHWVRTSEGIFGCSGVARAGCIQAVLVHPHASKTLWAAETQGGLFRSVDGGVRWTATSLTAPFSTSLGVPLRPDVLAYDAATDVLFAANTDGVFRSADAGTTWTGGSPSETYGPSGESLALHPQFPGLVFVTTGSGVLRSSDGGVTWQPTGYAAGKPRPAFVTVGAAPFWLYAGSDGGIYRSSDLGDTWEPVADASVGARGLLDSAAGLVVWSAWQPAVLRRAPGDSEFIPSTDGLSYGQVNTVVRGPTGTLYAAQTLAGVARSDDGGATWKALGVRRTVPDFLAVSPHEPSALYVDHHRTTDGGATWSPIAVQPPGFEACPIQDMAFVPSDPGTVYAVTTGAPGSSLCFGAVVRRSTDGGTTWNATGLGVAEGTAIWRLAVDPERPRTVHAVTSGTPSADRWAIRTSTDGGDSWSGERPVPNARRARRIDDLAGVPAMPGRLLAATDRGVFASDDAGLSWHRSRLRRPTTILAVSRSVPAVVYAWTYDGVFRSGDAGERWERRSDGAEGHLLQLELGGGSTDVLWGHGSHGIVRSTDGGARWTEVHTNGFPARAIGPDPALGHRAWVAAYDAGLLEIAITPCADATDCDDGEPCTEDACRPQAYGADARGCTYDVACTLPCAEDHDCDDGLRCSSEQCHAGACMDALDLNDVGCTVAYTRTATLCAPYVPRRAIARAIDRELLAAARQITRIGPAGSYGPKNRWIRRTDAALARVVRLGPKTGACADTVAKVMGPLAATVSELRAAGDGD